MNSVKVVSGDYTIQTASPTGRLTFTGGNVSINGNLTVSGNTTQVSIVNSNITNNSITLNANTINPNINGAYLVVARGTSPNVALYWNETVTQWQLSNDGISYANITTQPFAGILNVAHDATPVLGGNLNITTHTLYDTASNVQIYSNTVAGGGSGVFVTNSAKSAQELATKNKAIAYSIVFG